MSRLQNEKSPFNEEETLQRTTKKDEVIQEEDEYLDFVIGAPDSFSKKHTSSKDKLEKQSTKKLQKSTTTKKVK